MDNIEGSHSLQPLWFSLNKSSQGYLCISTSYVSAWADNSFLFRRRLKDGMQLLTISSASSGERPFSGALGALCKYLREYSREV